MNILLFTCADVITFSRAHSQEMLVIERGKQSATLIEACVVFCVA